MASYFNEKANSLISDSGYKKKAIFLESLVHLPEIRKFDDALRRVYLNTPTVREIALEATKPAFRQKSDSSAEDTGESQPQWTETGIRAVGPDTAVLEFKKLINRWFRRWQSAFDTNRGVDPAVIEKLIAALNAAGITYGEKTLSFEFEEHTDLIDKAAERRAAKARKHRFLVEQSESITADSQSVEELPLGKQPGKATAAASASPNQPESLDSQYSPAIEDYRAALISATEGLQLPLPEPVRPTMKQLSIDIPLIPTSAREAEDRNTAQRLIHTAVLTQVQPKFDEFHLDLDAAIEEGRRILILGDPGSGKSTRLRLAACEHASGEKKPGKKMPILLECRRFHSKGVPEKLSNAFEMAIEDYVADECVHQTVVDIEELLKTEGLLLLVDAIDEVPSDHREEFCKTITKWARIHEGLAIVVTSRIVGVQGFEQILLEQFESCRVDSLTSELKIEFLKKFLLWKRQGDSVETLSVIADSQMAIGRLTDTVLMLTLAAQVLLTGHEQIIHNRIALLYQALIELIKRKVGLQEHPVEFNELIPHLEWLAIWMRRQSRIRCFKTDAVKAFNELRKTEPTPEREKRSAQDLVNAAIAPIGILSVAGKSIDENGDLQEDLQFIHQILQEFLAARACRFRRGNTDPLETIQIMAGTIQTKKLSLKRYDRTWYEPSVDPDWQETIRMALAMLPKETTAQAFDILLPRVGDNFDTRRARGVFAVACLADGPDVTQETLQRIIQAFCEVISSADEPLFVTEHSTAQVAIRSAVSSKLGPRIIDELLAQFETQTDEKRMAIGGILVEFCFQNEPISEKNAGHIIFTLKESVVSKKKKDRTRGVLEFLRSILFGWEHVNRLNSISFNEIYSAIFPLCSRSTAERAAALWTLAYLSKMTKAFGKASSFLLSTGPLLRQVETIILDESSTDTEVGLAAAILGDSCTLYPDQEFDVVRALNEVANGITPRWAFPEPVEMNKQKVVEALLRRQEDVPMEGIYHALGSMGVFSPDAVQVLKFTLFDASENPRRLGEETLFLGLVGTEDASQLLVDSISRIPEKSWDRILFGVILADNVEATAALLAGGNFYPDALAFCLAGSRERDRGLQCLEQLIEHQNKTVRKAVAAALKRRVDWDAAGF